MPEPTKKKDAYAHRNSLGIMVPLEVDSDSDFAPGPYIPPSEKTKKLTKKRGSNKGKRNAGSDDDEDFAPVAKSQKTSTRRRRPAAPAPAPIGSNLLQELFAEDEEDDEDEEEYDEDESQNYTQQSQTIPLANPTRAPAEKPSNVSPPNEEDSVTESESDVPSAAKPVAQQTPTTNQDDSVTESESDPSPPPKPAPIPPQTQDDSKQRMDESGDEPKADPPKSNDDDSVTESESECSETEPESIYSDKELVSQPRPKPNFPLPDGQEPQPLILDSEKGIWVPASINVHLRQYQRDGIQFFYRQYKEGGGGLLGDDMGLGKTIQVISFLSAIMKKTGTSFDHHRRKRYVYNLQEERGEDWRRKMPPANAKWPTCLIIAPSSVCGNWEREFETWGYFEVGMYTGTTSERAEVLKNFKYGRLDVLVTSFDLARQDIELLCDEAFSCVIVDEAHRVKSTNSKTTEAFHRFSQRGRFGLTGTAIQNSYKEMWVILDWTNPGRVGTSKQWTKFITAPLTVGQSASASKAERELKQRVAEALVHELLPKLFLRRTKDVIKAQLPKKIDNVVFCRLTDLQIAVYKRILRLEAVQNLINRQQPCECGSKEKRKDCCHPFDSRDVFRFMSILIKLSNHLALVIPNKESGLEQYERDKEIADLVLPSRYRKNQDLHMWEAELCGKWKTLEALLREWKKDKTNKVLIFTKSVKLLDMLEHHVQNKCYGYRRLDGSTRMSGRMALVDQFQTDPDIFVFLISTHAGGTGLNLVAANKVVIFDPNWNPAHDLQAMDRAFRFGQTRDVTVVRLLGAGSVEELIYARQIYKQQQMAIGYEASVQTRYFDGVQGDASKRGELFGLENIFSLQEDKLPTKFIIEEAKLAEMDWAKANGSQKKRKMDNANVDVLEAETQVKGEEAGLKGLASFLFDDAPPPKKKRSDDDELQRILKETGASYSHRNDEIVAESRIAKEMGKSRKTQGTRQKKTTTEPKKTGGRKASTSKPAEPAAPWYPTRRKNHKVEVPLEERIQARSDALVGIKYIDDKSEIPELIEQMRKWTHAQREALFTQLDAWQRENWDF
ncbi:hypothetical protein NMY22_g1941 [Coprinellus aureogranulatus]|nr:hypothetical protein NMY22_g1941 [Coprinellus aureogranulatus]